MPQEGVSIKVGLSRTEVDKGWATEAEYIEPFRVVETSGSLQTSLDNENDNNFLRHLETDKMEKKMSNLNIAELKSWMDVDMKTQHQDFSETVEASEQSPFGTFDKNDRTSFLISKMIETKQIQ